MQQCGIPSYLCEWTRSFTTNRTLAFTFLEQLEDPKPFLCGLPEGSPASPILFLIYANTMLEVQHKPTRELNISYVDDTSFLQSSQSVQFAIKCLKERSEYHTERGKHLGLRFSPPKSELLHCLPKLSNKDKAKDLSHHPLLIINDQTISPSRSIKYLGIHIDESLTFKQHAISAAAKGKSALSSLLFLRHCGNGISTYIARHLILTLILPKMLWASPAWWTGADNILSPLATAYHSAARWATGLPPSTRISNLLTCAHLPQSPPSDFSSSPPDTASPAFQQHLTAQRQHPGHPDFATSSNTSSPATLKTAQQLQLHSQSNQHPRYTLAKATNPTATTTTGSPPYQ
jgi:hypothetical protein